MLATDLETIDCYIPADCAGQRLDQTLAQLLPYSRARLQQWLGSGALRVDGRPARPRDKVRGGERVSGDCPAEAAVETRPQPLALNVVYQDADLIVVNKPAGLVVHPAAGNPDGTLLNALLYYAPELERLPRGGLVHRLDKDTSGLLAVARSLRAHASLVGQLQRRSMGRGYRAIVCGLPVAGGEVDAPLGRHPVDRKRRAVVAGGKPALTRFRVERRFRAHSLLALRLATGRTHQIRVHMQHLRYPLVGDPVYGSRRPPPAVLGEALRTALREFGRQALHAAELSLVHPADGRERRFDAALPDDMRALLARLAADAEQHAAERSRRD